MTHGKREEKRREEERERRGAEERGGRKVRSYANNVPQKHKKNAEASGKSAFHIAKKQNIQSFPIKGLIVKRSVPLFCNFFVDKRPFRV